jgi:hypothetical protein
MQKNGRDVRINRIFMTIFILTILSSLQIAVFILAFAYFAAGRDSVRTGAK